MVDRYLSMFRMSSLTHCSSSSYITHRMHHLPNVRLSIPEDFIKDSERFRKISNMNLNQRTFCLCIGRCLTFRFASTHRRSCRTQNCQSLPVADSGLAKKKKKLVSCLWLFQAMQQVRDLNPQPFAHRQTCSSDIPQERVESCFLEVYT